MYEVNYKFSPRNYNPIHYLYERFVERYLVIYYSSLGIYIGELSVCVCARARARACMRTLVRYLSCLESHLTECLHSGPLRVASSSHSDGELWHNFLKQETNTHLLLSTQE